jgi:hypothetical protein
MRSCTQCKLELVVFLTAYLCLLMSIPAIHIGLSFNISTFIPNFCRYAEIHRFFIKHLVTLIKIGCSNLQYFTITFHMESIWNSYGMDIFHGFHMDSTWIPCPFHMDSFHMDSTWIPYGFHMIFVHKSN